MKKHPLIIFTFFLVWNNIFISAQNLSEKAEISIITCDPGNELYSTFGHSAIRIKDPIKRMDKVYNYGTFNFETPGFYMKFTRGQLDYMLSVSPYKYFIISYMNEKRGIREQILNLSPEQKNNVYAYLIKNALPQNMYYRYDFFFDNCATRVKDVMKNVLKDSMIIPEQITQKQLSFKAMLKPYLQGKDWERFGIHLALGQPANEIASTEESTFLPDYLENVFNHTQVIINGQKMPIVKEKIVLYAPKDKIEVKSGFFSPFLIFSIMLFFVLILSFIEYKNNKYFIILDKTLFFVFGFIGIIILLVWFGTEHKAVVSNWNIFWAMPLFFIASFTVKMKENKTYLRIFMLLMTFIMLSSLILDLTFYNIFDTAVIPIILALALRSFLIYVKRK